MRDKDLRESCRRGWIWERGEAILGGRDRLSGIYLFIYLVGGRNVLLWFHYFIYNYQIDFAAEEGALKRTLFNSGKGAHRSAHPSPSTPRLRGRASSAGLRGSGASTQPLLLGKGREKKYQAKPPQPALGINTPDRRIEQLKV